MKESGFRSHRRRCRGGLTCREGEKKGLPGSGDPGQALLPCSAPAMLAALKVESMIGRLLRCVKHRQRLFFKFFSMIRKRRCTRFYTINTSAFSRARRGSAEGRARSCRSGHGREAASTSGKLRSRLQSRASSLPQHLGSRRGSRVPCGSGLGRDVAAAVRRLRSMPLSGSEDPSDRTPTLARVAIHLQFSIAGT